MTFSHKEEKQNNFPGESMCDLNEYIYVAVDEAKNWNFIGIM